MLAIRDLMREVGGKLQAGLPELRQNTPGHADHAAVQWTADLWLSAMRLLADGSCRRANRSSWPALLRFLLESGQVVTHSPIVVSPAS
jgi:hypothetical protein